jgi:D-aspartate ligase
MPPGITEQAPAIVLGCHKIGLGIIRALGKERVPVVGVFYNKMDMGYVSKFVVDYKQCPHPDLDPEGFISSIVDMASKWEGGVLIPSDDATLIPVSKNKVKLGKYFHVVATDWQITQKYIEKKYTYAIAEANGVPAPRTCVPSDIDTAIEVTGQIGFPCLLKPSIGHSFFETFRKKMVFIESINELKDAYKRSQDAGAEMMLQEFIPGNDTSGVNYNSFFIDGEARIEVTAEKVRLSPPRTGFPRVVVSKHIPAILDPARKILSAIGYHGFSCMEFKRDSRNGVYKLMEINGRLNLSTPLSVISGVNFPYITYLYALKGEIPQMAGGFTEGFYWIDIGKDIIESMRSYFKERYSITDYLLPYFRPHVFTILSLTDPLPIVKRGYDIIKKIIKLVLHLK